MADRDKVDELVIELTARDKATEKIDNLAKSLRGLGDSLTVGLGSAKLNSVASSIKSISSATQELGRSTRAINNIPKLTTELSNMMNSLSNAPAISKDVLSLAHALSKIDGSAIKGFSKTATPQMNTGSATQEMQAIESEAKKVDSQTKEVTQTFNNFGSVARSSLKGISSLFGSLGKVNFGKINNGLNKVLGKVGSLGKKVGNLYKNVSLINKLSGMFSKKGFTTLLRYTVGIRSLFVLANRIRSAIEDGNKNLAQYSDTFNKSMSRYKSGLGTLKNAMSVAFAPLVNYFSDAVNRILDSFINAFNTIARLMGRLTGAKQVVQATRYYDDFGKSLGTASKNAKDLTTGIDELNILNDNSGGGGGGASTDVQDMFETVEVGKEFDSWINKLKDMWDKADFTELGTALADKINGALQNIDWKTIHKNARKLGKSLATFLNGVFEEELNGVSFGYEIGKTIGEAINTGIEYSYAFVTNFHWDSFGQFIADGFKGALETVKWKKMGKTLSKFVNGFLTTLITFFSDKRLWEDLGKSIGQFFSGIDWKETWFNLKKLGTAFFKAVRTTLNAWLKENPDSFKFVINLALSIGGIKILSKIGKTLLAKKLATALGGKLVTGGAVAGGLSLGTIMLGASIVIGTIAFIENYDEINNAIDGLFAKIRGYNSVAEYQKDTAIENAKAFSTLGYALGTVTQNTDLQTQAIQNMAQVHKAEMQNISKSGREFAESLSQSINLFETVGSTLSGVWETLKTNTEGTWGGLAIYLSGKFDEIKAKADLTFAPLRDSITKTWETVETNTTTTWNNIKDSLAKLWTRTKNDGTSKFNDLKTNIGNKTTETKNDTKTKWDLIKDNLGKTWGAINTDGSKQFGELKNHIILSFLNAKKGISEPLKGIVSMVQGMIDKVQDGFDHLADSIKEITTFDWTNPLTGENFHSDGISLKKIGKITLSLAPFFLESGGFVPNTNTGSLFWAGENGAEVVAHASGGTEVLNASQVASAVASGIREVVIDAVVPYLNDLVNSNQAIADKDMSVNIGDVDIARANRRGSSQLGLQLITS